MSAYLLIVEDDPALNQMLVLHFEDEGFEVDGAMTCADTLELIDANAYDLLLLDQQLPDGTGMELLEALQSREPDLPVVMMTGQHDLELAIEAIKKGAADFIHKPVDTAELQQTVDRLLANRRLSREVEALRGAEEVPRQERNLIGRSAAMLTVSKEIALSARSATTVLISGESGTGKEVVARLIHQHSGRTGPFVAVNCAAIVDTLLESELFGHEKGAFTGAQSRKLGKFELAQDGTLFLDEIGELASSLQAKLLRALQERVFDRVGGTQQISTNARVVAATNRDLMAEAAAGRFREDLAYRLNVIQIRMPPLRERKEDIPLLATALLERIAERIHKPTLKLAEAALDRLQGYDWPGNVREMENLLTQAAVHAQTAVITPDLLAFASPSGDRGTVQVRVVGGVPPSEAQVLRTLDEVEAEHVQQVLDYTGGHKGRTSEILGVSRPALDRKIEKYGLKVPGR
ncbi:MAG: sigma-54 dependent transcriptional regulator [Pseudomonadota bacterium]|nr:sigma-54 dependent transcriptional regulator [Pseudomonadota bacterium]